MTFFKKDILTFFNEYPLYLPLSSSKTSIPRDQQSAELSWPLFRMISGATYSGVPQNVHVFFPRPTFLAKPKSTWKKGKHTLWISSKRNLIHFVWNASTPAWRIHGCPVWCSQVWGLCRWFLWSAGKPAPRWHSQCKTEWCCHQMSPWKVNDWHWGCLVLSEPKTQTHTHTYTITHLSRSCVHSSPPRQASNSM